MSYQITLPGNRRAAARFIAQVRRKLLKALADNQDTKQTDIAQAIGVHRAVINRQLKGTKDISVGRAAEIAWALGLDAEFALLDRPDATGNHVSSSPHWSGDLLPGKAAKKVDSQVEISSDLRMELVE